MDNPDTLPVVYSFRRCPYAMRARLALLASQQACTLREVVLADKPAALLQASPKGTVPVLVLPSGAVIDQSLDIMLWALRCNDPLAWLPADGSPWDAALQWIAQCDGPFKHALDRYKYPHRYALVDGLAHRTQGAEFLERLEAVMAPHGALRSVSIGPSLGLADAAIAPFVRQFAHTDAAWFANQPWPALQRWLSAFEASAIFAQVMEKFLRREPGHADVRFPTHAK